MARTTKEWWDSLTEEGKFQAYKSMAAANKSHADTLNAVTNHLLGDNWYCMAMDIYGVNEEIVAAIKDKYPNINNNQSNTWKKIKDALSEIFS